MIAYDSSAKGVMNTNTWTHTCSGTNGLLLVAQFLSSNTTPTAPTYKGVPMTLGWKTFAIPNGNTLYVWYLLSPSVGSYTVTCSNINIYGGVGLSISYNGVKQTGFPDSSNYDSSSYSNTSPETISTTIVANNSWLVGFNAMLSGNSTATSGSSNRTDRQNATGVRGVAGSGFLIGSDSNGAAGGGSQSIIYTGPGGSGEMDLVSVVLSIAPAVASATGSFLFTML